MLRPAAEVQLLQHCAALVETLIERRRVFFIDMFVLCYLQLRWFDPSQAGEMRRGRGGGFVSFSGGKETKDRAASFSFASSIATTRAIGVVVSGWSSQGGRLRGLVF